MDPASEMPGSRAMCATGFPLVWMNRTASRLNFLYRGLLDFLHDPCPSLSEYILNFYYSTKLKHSHSVMFLNKKPLYMFSVSGQMICDSMMWTKLCRQFLFVKNIYFLEFEHRADGFREGTADIIRLIEPDALQNRIRSWSFSRNIFCHINLPHPRMYHPSEYNNKGMPILDGFAWNDWTNCGEKSKSVFCRLSLVLALG